MPVVAGIAAVAGGVIQAGAARSAARSQERSADQQIELQREIYDDTTERYSPYLDAGGAALQAYMYEMGLGAAPTIGGQPLEVTPVTVQQPASSQPGGFNPMHPFGSREDSPARVTAPASVTRYQVGGQTFDTLDEANAYARENATGGTQYQGFTGTPGYQFRFDQGTDAVNALAGARGGLMSGRTMQDLTKFGQGIASEEYGTHMNRLAGLTDMGMGAAGNQATAGNAFAAGAGNALAARGNAQAAGAIGLGNAISGTINNGIGIWQYQQGLQNGRVG